MGWGSRALNFSKYVLPLGIRLPLSHLVSSVNEDIHDTCLGIGGTSNEIGMLDRCVRGHQGVSPLRPFFLSKSQVGQLQGTLAGR